jgi:hypothetical protein
MILTPGAKKRFLASLEQVRDYVERDKERECIMYWTAQLMPLVVSDHNYYRSETPKPTPKKRKLNRTQSMIREDRLMGR